VVGAAAEQRQPHVCLCVSRCVYVVLPTVVRDCGERRDFRPPSTSGGWKEKDIKGGPGSSLTASSAVLSM
jgi:hypothetical protein